MNPVDYALLAQRAYTDAPTIGAVNSASRMRVYGDVHVFRGSDDVASWVSDFHVATTDVCGMGEIHAGFYGALAAILPACLALPRPAAVAGHSLGAALAILYAGVLAMLGHVVPVYAFEPPNLCADGVLADLFVNKEVPWFACRNGRDIVTQVPFGMTRPGPLTAIGAASFPLDNLVDHGMDRVIAALSG
ncbi:MAG: lipase family protein [Rhodanobacter sp.]